MQRLQHQLRVLHSADGRPGGDHLRERIYEDQPPRDQLYGVGICHASAHEPAGFTHSARKDEVDKCRGCAREFVAQNHISCFFKGFMLSCNSPHSVSLPLQPDSQYCHAGYKVGPRQIQHRAGSCAGGNLQQTLGLYGDRVTGHQRIHQ